MVDIFDEVSEDLRAERAQALLRRYGVLIVAAAILVVVGVAAWQAWRWHSRQQADQVAAAFIEATNKPAADSTPALAALAASAPEGYRTLARLRAAALQANAGNAAAALDLWNQVSADTAADPLLRSLADILWIQHQIDKAEPAALEGRIAPLLAPGNPWRPMAMESQAWLAIRTGQDARARDILTQLQADTTAPDGVRNRAAGLLTRFGGPAQQGARG